MTEGHDEWVLLRGAAPPYQPRDVSSIEAFHESQNSRFVFAPPEFCEAPPPITVGDADLAFFHTRSVLPVRLGRVQDGEKSVTRLSGRIVVHSFRTFGVVFDEHGLYKSGGYVRHWKHPPDYAVRREQGLEVCVDRLRTIPSTDSRILVFYDGNINNYKHWWLDMLHHLHVMVADCGICGEIILPRSDGEPTAWQIDALRAIGFAEPRNPLAAPAVRYAEIFFTNQLATPTVPYRRLAAFRSRALLGFGGIGSHAERIYIKRRAGSRLVANDGAVDGLLGRLGFVSLFMEDLSQAEQIAWFRQAAFVVSVHGAALANLLFCPPDTRVIELTPECEYRPHYWSLAASLGHRYGLLACPTGDGRFDGALSVDVDRLARLITTLD